MYKLTLTDKAYWGVFIACAALTCYILVSLIESASREETAFLSTMTYAQQQERIVSEREERLEKAENVPSEEPLL